MFRTEGGRPTSAYIPRFRNLYKQETDFLRGYASGFGAGRYKDIKGVGFGQNLTDSFLKNHEFGPWRVNSHMMGETIPKESNFLALDTEQRDEWGIPLLKVNIDYDDNDEKMTQDFFEQLTEMYKKAGFTNIQTRDTKQAPGLDIHEMGGVRMLTSFVFP